MLSVVELLYEDVTNELFNFASRPKCIILFYLYSIEKCFIQKI
jgi:hypothetical protein